MKNLVIIDHPLLAEATLCFFKQFAPWPVTFIAADSHHNIPPRSMVLLELFLPQDQNGIDIAYRLQQMHNDIITIVWTTKPAPLYIWAGMEYRVRGFLDKSMPVHTLIYWLNHAVATGAAWSGEMLTHAQQWNQDIASRLYKLTEDLWLLWDRLLHCDTNQQLAFHLGWSKRTIERRLTALYTTLNVHSRSEAINMAWKWHLVSPDAGGTWSHIIPDLFPAAQPLRDIMFTPALASEIGLEQTALGRTGFSREEVL